MVRANKKPKEGKTMKKIALIFLICVMQPAFATEMCARNNMIVVPLDSNVGGSGNSYNQAEMVWSATFPYGEISGEATCLSAAEGGKPSGSMGSYTNIDGDMLEQSVPAGLRHYDADNNERGYCWCRMTHPASSRWVFSFSSSASYCASLCALNCGHYALLYAALRSGLFGSVGK